ncbi:MAG: hypothetical protein AAFV85_18385 [Cyanobacteria bacterium J06634_6]
MLCSIIFRAISVRSLLPLKDHCTSPAMSALQWFYRFSQFYGEYAVRSPQARQQWLDEQRRR